MSRKIKYPKIKKLVSNNPDKYDMIYFDALWLKYTEYLKSCERSVFEIKPKEFNEWCLTEI